MKQLLSILILILFTVTAQAQIVQTPSISNPSSTAYFEGNTFSVNTGFALNGIEFGATWQDFSQGEYLGVSVGYRHPALNILGINLIAGLQGQGLYGIANANGETFATGAGLIGIRIPVNSRSFDVVTKYAIQTNNHHYWVPVSLRFNI